MDCGVRSQPCKGLAEPPLPVGVRRRYCRHNIPVKRRYGRCTDARSSCGGAQGKRQATSLPVHLRIHRECGKLCAADLQSCEPGAVWRPHATPERLVRQLCIAVRRVYRRHVWGVAFYAACQSGRYLRDQRRADAFDGWGGWTAFAGIQGSLLGTAAVASAALAVGSNIINNLPAGLITSTMILQASPPQVVIDASLIGVDLGPNLSITGSLATILWLTALRRDGENVSFWRFLKVGCLVMPPALVLSVGARLLLA